MHVSGAGRNVRPPKPVLLPADAAGPPRAPLAASPIGRDDPTTHDAAAWLVRRFRVRPALAATIAWHAGLGEWHHG
jgi:hypothetical protein